jgi:hypothetical protein
MDSIANVSNLWLQQDDGSNVKSNDGPVKLSDTILGELYAPLLAQNAVIGGTMDRAVVPRKLRIARHVHRHVGISLFALLSWCGLAAAQNPILQDANKPFSIRAAHLLGFENGKNNCSGTLSIEGDFLQFQQTGKSSENIKIGSVRNVFVGEESRQVGGLPMTLGKAAAPFGSGRVVSLFAHKKYDTLTLEYVDSDGGIHGAIFQLKKGQAEIVKNELIAQGVTISSRHVQSAKQGAAEVGHEGK